MDFMTKATIGDKTFNFPDDLLYTDKHQWVRIKNNEAIVGITDFAQGKLGEILTCDLLGSKMVGVKVKAGDLFEDISIEAQKAVADVYCPVSGEITAAHTSLEDEPSKINEDPYGEGWLFKLKISEKPALWSSAQYIKYLKTL
jgi:glycine cleavage system H protein